MNRGEARKEMRTDPVDFYLKTAVWFFHIISLFLLQILVSIDFAQAVIQPARWQEEEDYMFPKRPGQIAPCL